MVIKNFSKPMRTAFITTYPPRQCGIATFTSDLFNSMKQIYSDNKIIGSNHEEYLQIIALNDVPEGYDYNRDVCFSVKEKHREDYRRVADYINLSPIDVVSLQHEFGIFGGEQGSYILYLMGKLKKPVVTTLHTILREPTPAMEKTLKQVCELSTRVVVISPKAEELLKDIYGVSGEKITMIHHGTHDVPFLDSSFYKEQFKAEGRQLILTFGLVDDQKGLEYAIEALPPVVEKFPDVLYLILGATHPVVKKLYGEEYRHRLEKMVKEKKLSNNVTFHNHFVTLEQLIQFIVAADIYVTPYKGKDRVSSGTLAYALAAGKAIISTPYNYAEDLLADDRGVLVPFEDSNAIAKELIKLLEDDNLRNRIRKNAYQYGRQMVWREVANSYAGTFEEALYEFGNVAKYGPGESAAALEPVSLPEVNLKQLNLLTDDTGILCKALFNIPDRSFGYTTDDNARALTASIMSWYLFQDEKILPLLNTYLSFINHAIDPETGDVRNIISFDRKWQEEIGSEDCHGRTIWALGYVVAHPPNNAILGFGIRLFRIAMEKATEFQSPRAMAYAINGALKYLQQFDGENQVHDMVVDLSRKLYSLFKENSKKNWPWCENNLTYDNPRLTEALIAAGSFLDDKEMMEQGIKSLQWLIEIQTDKKHGHPSFVGNQGWYKKGGKKAKYDQLPMEAAALIDACQKAYKATGETEWREKMEWVFNWYFGNNDIHQPLYDFSTGGCYDSLQPAGVNQNQGGESTISFLLALHRMHQLAHQQSL